MGEVTKEDITRIHDRIDEMNKSQNDIAVSLATVATALRNFPKPPKQPCEYHKDLKKAHEKHIQEHQRQDEKEEEQLKESMNNWKQPAINTVFEIAKWLIIGAICLFAGTKL